MKKYLTLAMIAVLFSVVSCKKDKEPIVKTEEHFRKDMLPIINQYRAEGCVCGKDDEAEYMEPVPPLEWNDELAVVAYHHSLDMATNSFLSHTGSDGREPKDRVKDAGIKFGYRGENAAYRGNPSGVLSPPDRMMNQWINSKGHCKNIMNPKAKKVGIGVALNTETHSEYGTQLFSD